MAMGRRKGQRQDSFWIATDQIVGGPGHPFYRKLNEELERRGFDRFVEQLCEKFHHDQLGRPGVAPGVYFRMLLIGYFEGIDSERGIDWRCADSMTLRQFLGGSLTEPTPDHSTLCTIRRRIDLETHQQVFAWVLALVAEHGLLQGKTLGIDATTLEANAAMRSIVRKDTGESHEQFLTGLAQANGIATPTREQLAKLDRTRKNKASNDDWTNPHDPDAKITKMKDGRTHLAHKAEHAVDMTHGAIVSVTLQPADRGDTTSQEQTLDEAERMLEAAEAHGIQTTAPREVVMDKGYHSNQVCVDLIERGMRGYVSEPDRGRRNWQGKAAERAAVYANRRRIRGQRGKALLRQRGEKVERSFAHCYETGAMRRTHLRDHPNILKRLLVHVAGFNLALVLRAAFGLGKPRTLRDGLGGLLRAVLAVVWTRHGPIAVIQSLGRKIRLQFVPNPPAPPRLAAA